MKQVRVQLKNTVVEQLEATAYENDFALSGHISAIISTRCASVLKRESDVKQVLLDLIAASEPDPTFERSTEIPWEVTTPREAFN